MIKTIKELERVTNILKRNFDKLYRYKIKEVFNESGLIIIGHNENVRCPLGGTGTHLKIQYVGKSVYTRDSVDLTKLTKDEVKGLKDLLVALTDERLERIVQGRVKEVEDGVGEKNDDLMVIKFLRKIYEMIEDVAEMDFAIHLNLDEVVGEMVYVNGTITFYSNKGFGLFKHFKPTEELETFDEEDYEFVRRYGEDVLKVLSENI